MTTVVKSPNENTPRRVPILWQASGDSTLRLPSQPAWNDARGDFGVGIGFMKNTLYKTLQRKEHDCEN